MTDADLSEQYPIMKNMCGGCSKCVERCPAKAIEIPQQLNRDKCISNILDHDDLGFEKDVNTDGYFFECDICQNICPWNQKHIQAPLSTPYGERFNPDLLESIMRLDHLEKLDEAAYERELASYMVGYKLPFQTFKRNIEIIKRARKKRPNSIV